MSYDPKNQLGSEPDLEERSGPVFAMMAICALLGLGLLVWGFTP
jgi:hypothetical protein